MVGIWDRLSLNEQSHTHFFSYKMMLLHISRTIRGRCFIYFNSTFSQFSSDFKQEVFNSLNTTNQRFFSILISFNVKLITVIWSHNNIIKWAHQLDILEVNCKFLLSKNVNKKIIIIQNISIETSKFYQTRHIPGNRIIVLTFTSCNHEHSCDNFYIQTFHPYCASCTFGNKRYRTIQY